MSASDAGSRLHLEITTEDNVTIVKCTGKLVAGVTDILRDQVKPLLTENRRVVLDLTDLSHMDSLGLGSIVSLYVSAKASGCDLKLINLSKRIRELIRITNLTSLFEVYGEHITKIL